MHRFLWFFVCIFFLCYGYIAYSKERERVHYTLHNGLDVYLIRDDALPIVSHVLLYKVGSVSDPRGSSGLAHYLEHLMFRTSKNIPHIAEEIHRLNSFYNAFTSDYYTVYHQLFHKNKLEDVMRLEAERMHNLSITNEAAQLEKKIVLEERGMRVDNVPLARLEEEMYAAYYRNDTSWNTIGWEEEIALFDASAAQKMYKACYRPSNAALIILGDIDISKVKEDVSRYYGVLSNPSARWRSCYNRTIEPEHLSDITVRMLNDKTEDRALAYLFGAPNISDKGHVAMLVASQVLAGGETSLLGVELVHNLRLALNAAVDYDYLTLRGGLVGIIVLPLSADVKLKTLDMSVTSLLSEVAKNGVSHDDIEAAKMMLKVSLMKVLDGFNARSIAHSIALSVGANFDYFHRLAEQISNVKVEEVNAAIKGLLSMKKVTGYLDK